MNARAGFCKSFFILSIILASTSMLFAQRKARGGGGNSSTASPAPAVSAPVQTTPSRSAGVNPSTGKPNSRRGSRTPTNGVQTNQNQSTESIQNVSATPVGEKKLIYDTASSGSGGGVGEKPKVSLRMETALVRSLVKDRRPLQYEDLREDDAVFSAIVWREIDCREKINRPFLYSGKEDNGDQRFFSIVMQAVLNPDSSQRVAAFSTDDDRFTTEIKPDRLMRDLAFEYDTIPDVMQADGTMATTITKKAKLNPDSVFKFRLKEQYIFDKESSRMFVRIIGICPVARMKPSAGAQSVDKPLFWLYYPDLRPTLAKYESYNEKNFSGRMSWEEVFESRYFSSYITKTSLNNSQNLDLKTLYPKNPLLRLIDGDKIKDKIFNYEQDLWSY